MTALDKARYAVSASLAAAVVGSGVVAVHLAHDQAALTSAAAHRRSQSAPRPAVLPGLPSRSDERSAPTAPKPTVKAKAKRRHTPASTPSPTFQPVAPLAPAGSGGTGGGTTSGS